MYRRFFFRDLVYRAKSRQRRNDMEFKKRKGGLLFFIIFIALMVWSYSYFEREIRPTVTAMAEAKAKTIAIHAINDAINEEIVKKIKYEDLVIIQKDSQDRVTALKVDVVKQNEIQALVSQVFQDKISNIDTSELRIPIGNLFNSSILSGWGPRLKIRIIPVGTVQSTFKPEFTTAGINQTRFRTTLEVKGRIGIIVPLISTYSEVATSIPVAETVIVGEVPTTYLDVTGASEEEAQKAREIAPNMATSGKP